MVANCRVLITRKKLIDRQYIPDDEYLTSNSVPEDSDFFDQAVDLLLLIYRDQDTLIDTNDIANCTEGQL